MSQGFEHHVAQQSRRDRLRVQNQQFANWNQNPNLNQDLMYNCTNMMTNSPAAILDFSSHDSDWITNQINPNHPLHQSHLYHLPTSAELITAVQDSHNLPYENTLQAIVGSSLGLEMASHEQQQQQQTFHSLNVENQKVAASETQGLSLSLASKPLVELHMPSQGEISPPASKLLMMDPWRSVGPLGPFTGYATILKSSKLLKPAQQLLDEFCSAVTGLKVGKQEQYHRHRNENSVEGSGSKSRCDDRINYNVGGGNSGACSSSFHSSTEVGHGGEGAAGVGSGSSCLMQHPEIQQRKLKLLYLQEEVCRRYKQYHQQMQMVVSSFESVAGLSAATPYTSLALKAVSKQFRSLKLTISNQLRHMSRILGEDFISSPSSSSRGESITTPRLKYLDQSLGVQKARQNTSLGFLDNNQPVWRLQRGLPERAVSVLRAWLFEHFLHPYPTDTDKNMLATQTGLTRNQVSNWFINARVRLWKPMVEEIHMIESKGMAEMDLNSSDKNDRKSIMDDNGGQPYSDQGSKSQSNKHLDCFSPVDPMVNDSSPISNMEQWYREKRSKMEDCTIPGEVDGGLMSLGYQGGINIGGLGSVSLTLGLPHNEDAQQQQQQQQQLRHFGSQMLS